MNSDNTAEANGSIDVSVPPSGRQFEISFEDQLATIVEVGGGIRTYSKGRRAVLNPYAVDAICDGAHGTPLIPWPNRLADGRYTFEGVDHQVALTEPEKHNAIHGFLRWRGWDLIERAPSAVTVGTTIYPLKGYPFTVDIRVSYELSPDGLRVETTATNLGQQSCPYGAGQHPYLSPGTGTLDACRLQLDASTRVDTDNDRQLPTGLVSVDGTEYDFREPRQIGDLQIDYAFTDLIRDGDGRSWARLFGQDGMAAHTWVDEHHSLIQLYSGDTLAPNRRRLGLGTEPMTCPPNAFSTGESLIHLEPTQSVTTVWGACLTEG